MDVPSVMYQAQVFHLEQEHCVVTNLLGLLLANHILVQHGNKLSRRGYGPIPSDFEPSHTTTIITSIVRHSCDWLANLQRIWESLTVTQKQVAICSLLFRQCTHPEAWMLIKLLDDIPADIMWRFC